MNTIYVEQNRKANASLRLNYNYEAPEGCNKDTILAGEEEPEVEQVEVYYLI